MMSLAGAKEEGIEEGKRTNSIEIAKKMKEKNISIQLIMELTGLNKKEIETL